MPLPTEYLDTRRGKIMRRKTSSPFAECRLKEIVQIKFQSSAAADKHADLMVYHSLLHRHYRVPVHTIIILLRPQAAHGNLSGSIRYAPREGRGKMDFDYEVVRL